MDPARREAKRAQRRAEVLEAAFELVGAQGLESLTLTALAAATGSAVASLYHYFPGKDALLAAMQRQALERFRDRLEERLVRVRAQGTSGSPAVDALRRALVPVETYLSAAGSREHQLMDAFLSAPRPVLGEATAADLEVHVGGTLARCAELLEEAATAGALRPGDGLQRANILWVAAYGLDHFRKRDRLLPEHRRARAAAQDMLRALLTGWGAPPDAVERVLAQLDW